ncbi:DUF5916 domain-containing protein [Aquimonas sp.]|jgi:hypothetical protein|uniref:DUF5916 domain-containing protein n=1 Tax=Aquimonas sp. TaxID=1872588 RepID=UPI0037BF08F0
MRSSVFLPLGRLLFAGIACFLVAATAMADEIELDGRLDEAAWADALHIDDFRTVLPLTREQPPVRTEVRVLSRDDGLYFGIRAEQPAEFARTRHPTRRDAQARADRINLIIDFEGAGSTAYEFTVSLSGGVQDAIVTGQNSYKYDWDGVWQQAVAEDADGWSVEVRLPWGIAPLGRIEDGRSTIGVYLSRVIEQDGLRFSHPHYDFENPTFVADMARFEIDAHSGLRLDVVPYVAVANDRLAETIHTRAGADFYLASGGHRLNATLKPDFGQVESDALVVDFSAIETFFSEKRPFFTENQSLFDVPLGGGALLVNTRRIGARPDAGPEGIGEVDAAIKYTGAFGPADIGALIATEEDSSLAEGREFRVLRGRMRAASGEYGVSLTDTLRPTLQREARTGVVDGLWRPLEGLQLRGAAGQSDISDEIRGDRDGRLLWLRMDHVISERWRQEYEFNRYGRDLQLADLGYLPRADLTQLRASHSWYTRSYPAGSRLRESVWETELLWQRNSAGERLYAGAELLRQWRFVNAARLYAYVGGTGRFVDDLILRGNGSVHLPAQPYLGLEYESQRLGRWRFDAGVEAYRQGLSGWARELELAPTWFIGEQFSTTLAASYIDSSDWLIWDGDNRLGQYARRQVEFDWTLEWFPRAGHEVRLRAQYVGLDARARAGYAVLNGTLQSAAAPSDFSLATLAAQIRYRYEFGPQRELYLVLSRGGDYFGEDEDAVGLDRLFDRAGANETANQVLAKLRWGF